MLPRSARLLGFFILLGLAVPAVAQTRLTGRVVDASVGTPVVGGIVRANGPSGEQGASTLTNPGGAFILNLPQGFQLASLTVARIGYASQTFDAASFTGTTGIELRVASAPIQLEGIVATAQSLCRDTQGDAGAVQTIWDEAKKSLEITALSLSEQLIRFETESYERDLTPSEYEVLRGDSRRLEVTSASPYRSISVEQMTERGWAEGTLVGGMNLFAPDAGVLLTDAFANQHCFTAEVTDDAVLLHFTPNRERRGYPELQGTLVLHPRTSELVELRFSYVGIPELEQAGHAGGEIAFYAAPNGIRVVRQWSIRAPVMTLVRTGVGRRSTEGLRVDYVHEDGGRILAVHTDGQAIRLAAPPLDLGSATPGRDPRASGTGQVASSRMMSGGTVAELVIRNDDSKPFQVNRVLLESCINTAVPCDDYPVDVVVPAGESRVVFRMRKQIARDPFAYEWDYEGESLEPIESVVVQPAPAPVDEPLLANSAPQTASERSRSTLLTVADIDAARFRTALDVIRALRPQWLNRRAEMGLRIPAGPPPAQVKVYVDNVNRSSNLGMPPEEGLREVSTDVIETIEWLDGPSATLRWGSGHQLGAIVITTRR